MKTYSESFLSLSTTPTKIFNVLHLISTSKLNWKPNSWDDNPGENFSAIEQICHLKDIKQEGYHKRIQSILKEDNPILNSIDGYKLSIQHNYKEADVNEAILDFNSARDKTISMISKLDNEQWFQTGYFEGYGNVTMISLIHFLCSHDFEHLASLRWLLGKLNGEK